jgi:dephospho-CoA kinase
MMNHATAIEKIERLRSRGAFVLVGLTGGIASGKTAVSKMLEAFGAPLIDMDQLARKVVEPGRPVLKKIADYFGGEILYEDGALNRKALSNIVFNHPEKRAKLESFTHPAILEACLKEISRILEKTSDAVIVVSVPLLFEVHLQFLFDKIIVVHIPPELQAARLAARDGISPSVAGTIMKAQLPIDEKVGHGDFVIDNTGTPEETRRQVVKIWRTLEGIKQGGASA